ncbi:uncharacterized protein BX664DRAFT_383306 [Halteromyces radiatus]|uniref:uncharacterized protein n=1 Tax=Halteromyces radiatus TaxID=101107 RepID=UPI0022202039|nr:uncharacterized protein BX664DRAFT_383306 [Halteromyces radiatus]KAI8096936.1 hypothetical protein BX664DRAFT_383306 [Halteromyces radiatus]
MNQGSKGPKVKMAKGQKGLRVKMSKVFSYIYLQIHVRKEKRNFGMMGISHGKDRMEEHDDLRNGYSTLYTLNYSKYQIFYSMIWFYIIIDEFCSIVDLLVVGLIS